MVEIMRHFHLNAAHRLPRVPDGHKCSNMHGHNWRIEIWLRGEPDERGWFCDYDFIDTQYAIGVHRHLDHHCLNDHIENPTTENLCTWIVAQLKPRLPWLCRVVAWEGEKSCVSMQVEPAPAGTSTNFSDTGGD